MAEGKESEDYDSPEWKGGKSNIICAVRVRPVSENERKKREEEVVSVFKQTNIVVKDPGHTATNQMRQKRLRERKYAFDSAFAPGVGTDVVYRATVRHLIDGVLQGYNATCFAYGATGSGKTFTMLGTPNSPGVMVRTLADLYERIESRSLHEGASFKVRISYVEVYNENIRDLLSPDGGGGGGDAYLDLREDPVKGNCVAGVTEHEVGHSAGVMSLLSEGNRRRTQEPTAANRESSRSHAVLTITIQGRDAYGGKMRVGKLSLIDLAGSERAANTQNRGLRLLEGANINKSLLALGNCITALANKGAFVPYRDSKLTRLLKDSLGGNARTVMISCVSPAGSSFEETCNTLKYANRAKNIKTAPTPQVLADAGVEGRLQAFQVNEYDSLIVGLRQEVAQLKSKLASTGVLGGAGDAGEGAGATAMSSTGSFGYASIRRGGGGGGGGLGMGVGGAGLGGEGGGGGLSGPTVVPVSALASPALLRRTINSRKPAEAAAAAAAAAGPGGVGPAGGPGGGGEGGVGVSGGPMSPHITEEGSLVIPEGYILVNAAEAAAASEKLVALREALLQNFQDRMQLRRSLAELQAQNTENSAEVARHSAALARVEQSLAAAVAEAEGGSSSSSTGGGGGGGGGGMQRRVGELRGQAARMKRSIAEVQDSIAHNSKTRADLLARLERAESAAEHMRGEMEAASTTSEERRELLSLEYRVYLLELQRVEMEQSAIATRAQIAARESALRRARVCIRGRDRIIRRLLGFIARGGGGAASELGSRCQLALDGLDGDLWSVLTELLGSEPVVVVSVGGDGGGPGSPARHGKEDHPHHHHRRRASSALGDDGGGAHGSSGGGGGGAGHAWHTFATADLGLGDEGGEGTPAGHGLGLAEPVGFPAGGGGAGAGYIGFGGTILHTLPAAALHMGGGGSSTPTQPRPGQAGGASPAKGRGAGVLSSLFGGSSSASAPHAPPAAATGSPPPAAHVKARTPHSDGAPRTAVAGYYAAESKSGEGGVSLGMGMGMGVGGSHSRDVSRLSEQAEAILSALSTTPAPAPPAPAPAAVDGNASVLSAGTGQGSYFSAPGTPSTPKPLSWIEKAASLMRRVGGGGKGGSGRKQKGKGGAEGREGDMLSPTDISTATTSPPPAPAPHAHAHAHPPVPGGGGISLSAAYKLQHSEREREGESKAGGEEGKEAEAEAGAASSSPGTGGMGRGRGRAMQQRQGAGEGQGQGLMLSSHSGAPSPAAASTASSAAGAGGGGQGGGVVAPLGSPGLLTSSLAAPAAPTPPTAAPAAAAVSSPGGGGGGSTAASLRVSPVRTSTTGTGTGTTSASAAAAQAYLSLYQQGGGGGSSGGASGGGKAGALVTRSGSDSMAGGQAQGAAAWTAMVSTGEILAALSSTPASAGTASAARTPSPLPPTQPGAAGGGAGGVVAQAGRRSLQPAIATGGSRKDVLQGVRAHTGSGSGTARPSSSGGGGGVVGPAGEGLLEQREPARAPVGGRQRAGGRLPPIVGAPSAGGGQGGAMPRPLAKAGQSAVGGQADPGQGASNSSSSGNSGMLAPKMATNLSHAMAVYGGGGSGRGH